MRSILVVDDNAVTRKMYRLAISSSRFKVSEADGGAAALKMVRRRRPDLIVQDLRLGDMDGIELLSRIREIPGAEAIPVLCCSGLMSKMEEARSLRATFSDYLFKPFEMDRLLESVHRFLAPDAPAEARLGVGRRVLLVDDDPVQCKLNALQLDGAGFSVTTAGSGPAALAALEHQKPDAVIADLLMPGMTGLELCVAIRRLPGCATLPVIIASSTFAVIEDDDRTLAKRMGASAFVARTPALDDVVDALLSAIDSPVTPVVAKDATALGAEYVNRLIRQLEHQSALNVTFSRRIARDAALLSVSATAAALASQRWELNDLLHDILTRTLDAAGASVGAIFRLDDHEQLVVAAQIGMTDPQAKELSTFFGHRDLLLSVTRGGEPVRVPSDAIPTQAATDLLTRLEVTGLYVFPLVAQGTSRGALLVSTGEQRLDDEWLASVYSIAGQIAQAIALAVTVERLSKSEARYRALFDRLPVGLYISTPEGRFLDVNERCAELFGHRDRTTMLSTDPVAHWMTSVDRDRFSKMVEREGYVRNFEAEMRRADGSPIWVSLSTAASLAPDGKVRQYEGVAIDMTERHRAQARLLESEQRFLDVAENVNEVFFIADLATRKASYVNPAYEAIFKQTRQYAFETPMAWTERIHPDDRAQVLELYQAARNGASTQPAEFRIVHPDGAVRWLRAHPTAVRDEAGAVVRIVGIAEDITELKQTQEQFIQSQKMEAIGLLAGGIAHDFNNLLTVILSWSAVLLEGDTAEAEAREMLTQINSAGERAAGLTRQLLAFSRKQVLAPRLLDLNEVVTGTEKLLRRLVGENIELRTQLAATRLTVRADAGQLEQVIMNLAVNARDAMPHGGILTIETTDVDLIDAPEQIGELATLSTGHVVVSVTDNGMGMSAETKAHLFEPFFTTKAVGKGTGLGLATVHGIVLQTGGFVRVSSELGVGTTFAVYLPHVDKLPVVAEPKSAPQQMMHGRETVLVVEDDAQIRNLTASILKARGYAVVVAEDGNRAIEVVAERTASIDLLLTDVIMPGMNGHELAHQLMSRHPEMRVLYVSGYPDEVIAHQGVLVEGVKLLQKPFTPAVLLRRVREVLDEA